MAPKKPPPAPADSSKSFTDYLPNPFRKKPQPKKKAGLGDRITNIMKNNYRGLLGILVPIAAFSWQLEKDNTAAKVKIMWLTMTWFFLTQPVKIPVVGLIPIFALPMAGVMSTVMTCSCYMTARYQMSSIGSGFAATYLIVTFFNSLQHRVTMRTKEVPNLHKQYAWLHILVSSTPAVLTSGWRVYLIFKISSYGCRYTDFQERLVFKASVAAYIMSIFSSRLIISSTLTQIVTNAFSKFDTGKKDPENPNFTDMRNIINNAIHTSAAIGGTAFFHTAFVTILFRGAFVEFAPKGKEYPDIFNYLQYSAFAFPLSFIMFLLNVTYHMLLINWSMSRGMSAARMEQLRGIFLAAKKEIPRKISLHERLSAISLFVVIVVFFFRWNQWVDSWSEFRRDPDSPEIPRVKDTTVAAMFIILLHIIPKGYGFVRFLDAEKKSELPPLKAESAILWWKFVDSNVYYGYLFIFGATHSLVKSARLTGLDKEIAEGAGATITTKSWNVGLFVVVLVAVVLSNLTTQMAACCVWIPFVLCAVSTYIFINTKSIDAALPWPNKVYLAALGIGIGCQFGFCIPFQYTPAYFCHYTGKVPIKKMVKYSIVPVIMCLICLYLALLVWGPFLFDPEDYGIKVVDAPPPAGQTKATTPPPTEGGEAPPADG